MNPNFAAEKKISDIIDGAEEFLRRANTPSAEPKPRLFIEPSSPDRTVSALGEILARDGDLFDRGVPVRVIPNQVQNCMIAKVMTPVAVVHKTHQISRPYKLSKKGLEIDAPLPRGIATMYLDWSEDWNLRPLNGIASVPLLRKDGDIFSTEGYDCTTGVWLENMPDLTGQIPEYPTRLDAEVALLKIRNTFRTFCFSDAESVSDAGNGAFIVDTSKPPGRDESAFLNALLTAVARPSLYLAPGVIVRAAPMSGAGAGKGLLARCISIIAFGHEPHAVTGGGTSEEIEKRIAAELMGCSSVLFLDNLNNTNLKSDILASALTERPARVRLLGKSEMVNLNTSAFVVLTGNGLSVSEDLARRFLMIELDPRTENPEARFFESDIREDVKRRRHDLLAALLMIWRWGRMNNTLCSGRPLGSYEQWCLWVRDPLLALGCHDPAERIAEAKERDSRRQTIAEFFAIMWKCHGDQPVAASKLHDYVKMVIDPQKKGRQFVSAHLEKLSNTRMAGFILTRQKAPGAWGPATYALQRSENHRDHRDHNDCSNGPNSGIAHVDEPVTESPSEAKLAKAPMPPMPSEPEEKATIFTKVGWSTRG